MASYLILMLFFIINNSQCFKGIDMNNNLMQEIINRYTRFQDGSDSGLNQFNDEISRIQEPSNNRYQRMDDILLGREPSIRDIEYLQHSSLWGNQYIQGGTGEGNQILKTPNDSVRPASQLVKSDAILPAYCNPPNPCPLGYTAEDGCLEEFENTAAFSRDYQSQEECICDTEHMFDCPRSSTDNRLNALSNSLQLQGVSDKDLNNIIGSGDHKVVAKKFHQKKKRPNLSYLAGDALPVVAKKAPNWQMIE